MKCTPLDRFNGVVERILLFFFQAEDGIRDRNVTGVQTCALPILFHQGALWPHLDARAHVAFALDLGGVGRDDMAERIETVLRRLGLTDVAGRKPDDLTLEQRRRLALARALAVEPRVLLLDEPLAHLDPGARKTMRVEVARLHRDLAVTTICATRDAADALALSDR